MISVENIKDLTEGFLNANSLGVEFKLFADVGEITREKLSENYTENKVVGLLEFLPSTIAGQGFKFLQLETKATIYIDGTGIKQSAFNQKVDRIKGIINRVIEIRNRIPTTYTIDGVDYNTTISFGLPQNLDMVSLGYMKKALPVELYMSWAILLNGVSSNSVKFFIDDQSVVATTWNIDRTRIIDANAKSDEEHTKSVEKVNGITITLNSPLLDNNLGNMVYDDVMSGETNKAHLVQVQKGQRIDNYICIFGDNGLAGQEGLNVGSKYSLVEGDQDLLEYGEGWDGMYVDVSAGQTYALPVDGAGTIFWGDGSVETWGDAQTVISHEYAEAGTYHIKTFGGSIRNPVLVSGTRLNSIIEDIAGGFENVFDVRFDNYDDEMNNTYQGVQMTNGVVVADGYNQNGWIDAYYLDDVNMVLILGRHGKKIKANADCSYMFRNMTSTADVDITKVDFSETTNMKDMFNKVGYSTNNVVIRLAGIDTSNVTDMSGMFDNFANGSTGGVAIYGLEDLNTSKVTDMSFMFSGVATETRSFSLNLSNFDTSNVTNMANMFYSVGYEVSNFVLDLSSFDTSKVTNMGYMFENMHSLKTIKVDAEKWSIEAVVSGNGVFDGCVNLVGGAGTTYNSSNINYLMAKIDGGVNNPGYLTEA